MKMKETDLFSPVRDWLTELEFDVFSEVMLPRHGYDRADVVGRKGRLVTIVELKTALSLELIGQAVRWRHLASYVFVAVPKRKTTYPKYALDLLKREGVGLLEVDFSIDVAGWCSGHALVNPKLNRHVSNELLEALTPDLKANPPGGHAGGGYITPYKLTMQRVRDYLSWQKDWVTVDDILTHVTTHYWAPKQSLAKALLEIEQDWCETAKFNGRRHFRIRPSSPAPSYRVKDIWRVVREGRVPIDDDVDIQFTAENSP